jgi:tyrosinase
MYYMMFATVIRWFVWQFEKALQTHTGRCVYLPYWDSERDSEWEQEADFFHEDTFGRWGATSNRCVNEGIASVRDTPFQWSYGLDGDSEGCVERRFLEGFAFAGEAEILSMISNLDAYSDGFRQDFEVGPHMLVHGIIGGHMSTNWSPADPIFWLHHSNVDRIWSM